jgi:hypothetical protein
MDGSQRALEICAVNLCGMVEQTRGPGRYQRDPEQPAAAK